jgi:DNA-binding GntR family transcriptional regulator
MTTPIKPGTERNLDSIPSVYSIQSPVKLQTPIERPNVTRLVADALREAIVDGRIRAGSRINEVRLSNKLKVSRTPLREALMHLSAEGTVQTLPRRGFFIRALTIDEFENVYSIRAILDPQALRLTGLPNESRLAKLEKLNRQLVDAKNAAKRIELDNAWHLELLTKCPNQVLVDLIQQFMARTRRYELALLREQRNAEITASEHTRVIAALRDGNLDNACIALRENMESGRAPIISWLKKRESAR